jgi:hypothetical protein
VNGQKINKRPVAVDWTVPRDEYEQLKQGAQDRILMAKRSRHAAAFRSLRRIMPRHRNIITRGFVCLYADWFGWSYGAMFSDQYATWSNNFFQPWQLMVGSRTASPAPALATMT